MPPAPPSPRSHPDVPSLAPADAARPSTLPLLGLAAVVLGALLVAALQVLPPTDTISPIRRTISEYALTTSKWVFDAGVLLVALGSAVVFLGLVRRGPLLPRSAACLFGGLWTLSLLVIVVFPKHNWSVGPSIGGNIHRVASIVAFVCLPLAVVAAARTVLAHTAVRRRIAQALGVTALLWFVPIVIGIVRMMGGGEAWWRFVPLGLVERLMAVNALLAVGFLVIAAVLPRRLDMRQVTAQA
ncbi:hypothetical protein CFN78_14980 [Amycolatopsis antarctica]|uniref:DUF998 domain-containing protein n=1 Tax=Amycolatopsis antarctica TaxID=1854586 RepID=A0A263D1J7_9PSEU|nr:DUF998 domain-containing protein [Amycolatopsis antarctica]OZM72312.1 hypothetical protein CFN78_14980 [Amycolatopsis antarctica]